jgi:colanic acid/amylovoran biosynthesis glycosyltransferase
VRIAFVVGGFPETSETFILDQMTGLIDRGHEVMILARPPADPRAPSHASVDEYGLMQHVLYWDNPQGNRRPVLSRTLRLLRTYPMRTIGDLARCLGAFAPGENLIRMWSRATMLRVAPMPDVLLAQFGTNAVVAQQVRDICALGVPLVATFLGYDLSSVLRERKPDFYTRLFARGELMLPLSDYFRTRLISLGCPPEKIRVQRLGVDTGRFAFRERTAAPGEPVRFVSVARLVEKKGLETGLRAFALLRRDVAGATWHIAGDGPLRPQLEELRRALSLTESVVLRGAMPREGVRRLLDESHVFLAPSVTAADGDQEGIPVAIMEAMAAGLPVVSTLHSGIPELVRDGLTGLLVPERDPAALADALGQLARAPERWGEMGRQGRAVVEREFDSRFLGDRLAEILLDVAQRAR